MWASFRQKPSSRWGLIHMWLPYHLEASKSRFYLDRDPSRYGQHLDRTLLLDGGSSRWGLLLLDGPPMVIQVEPLKFPNLKASILKFEILHILKEFGLSLVKIRPVALSVGYPDSSRCEHHLDRNPFLDGDSSRCGPPIIWKLLNGEFILTKIHPDAGII